MFGIAGSIEAYSGQSICGGVTSSFTLAESFWDVKKGISGRKRELAMVCLEPLGLKLYRDPCLRPGSGDSRDSTGFLAPGIPSLLK